MSVSISQLLSLCFSTIRKDPVILAPYLVFFLLLQLMVPATIQQQQPLGLDVQAWSTPLLVAYFLQWLVELFFKLTTITLARSTFLTGGRVSLSGVLKVVLFRYFPTLFWCALVLSPFLAGLFFLTPVFKSMGISLEWLWFLMGLLLIPIGLVVEFIPTTLVSIESNSVWKAGWITAILVWKHLRAVFIFMALSISVLLVSVLGGSILGAIPGSFGMLLSTLSQGLGYAVIYTLNPLLYSLIASMKVSSD